MNTRTRIVVGTGLALLLWAVFTWPLLRFMTEAIPSSNRNLERYHYRQMIPGDHLQLLYHFWLAGDMMAGRTPLFENRYEFNTGDDAARRVLDMHYLPFSAVFAGVSWIGSRPFAWNITGMVSIGLTFACLWGLARRYARDEAMALLAALAAMAVPYRWITLLCGSPTGFAMALVPATLWCVDRAVRDRSLAGGIGAGSSLFLSFCADQHVFYFSILATPFWCLVALAAGARPGPGGEMRPARRLGAALAALAVLLGSTVIFAQWIKGGYRGTDVAGGRTWQDVARCSPDPSGLIAWQIEGIRNHVFLGVTLMVLLGIGLLVFLLHSLREGRSSVRRVTVAGLLLVAIGVGICLALGTRGPHDGACMKAARAFLPKYSMIRQPMKIFVLMPSFIAVLAAVLMDPWARAMARPRLAHGVAALMVLAVLIEGKLQTDPTLSGVRSRQAAYAAVAQDAASRGREARAIVIPFWPGDSHYASLYEHYVSLYRIRMVDGYSPVRSLDYMEKVFKPLESINAGEISDGQVARLQGMGVGYVLLHEDPFPAKVTGWPAARTLARLREHPRLQELTRDEEVWAFRIVPEGEKTSSERIAWEFEPSARTLSGDPPEVRIPAPCFFYSGHSDGENLVFLKDREPDRCVMRGGLLPLDPGDYTVYVEAASKAPPGTLLGIATLTAEGADVRTASVVAGEPCEIPHHQAVAGTPQFQFIFARNADMVMGPIRVRSEKPAP